MKPQERGCWLYCPYCGRDYDVTWAEFLAADWLQRLDLWRQPGRPWPKVLCLSSTGRPVFEGFAGGWKYDKRIGIQVWVAPKKGARMGRLYPLGLVLWEIE